MRLRSVGEEDGSRNGSLKLAGTAPEVVDPVTPLVADDDFMTGFADEGAGDLDVLDFGALSVLENDINGNGVQADTVAVVSGDAALVGTMVVGDNGGFLLINGDGTVDFDAAGYFDHLEEGQSDTTSFTYGVDDGDVATVTVTVLGASDPIILD